MTQNVFSLVLAARLQLVEQARTRCVLQAEGISKGEPRQGPGGSCRCRPDLAADLDEHHVYVRNVEVHLTSTEFRLLACLLEHAGQLVTHRQVLASVWGGG